LIDWNAIEDRTRNLISQPHWKTPSDIIQGCIEQYKIDKWSSKYQQYRIEVWIEKDALVGVIRKVCKQYDVPYFACRGYNSQSEMWAASKRFKKYIKNGQIPFILHLGDHDPSGIDMSRDIKDRLKLFLGQKIKFSRLALNMTQVESWNPPPNPAKVTDPRAKGYITKFGTESWELDALEPNVINGLIEKAIQMLISKSGWEAASKVELHHKDILMRVSEALGGT